MDDPPAEVKPWILHRQAGDGFVIVQWRQIEIGVGTVRYLGEELSEYIVRIRAAEEQPIKFILILSVEKL